MKREHVRQGHDRSSALDAELKHGVRSCERGQGPPKQAAPCPIEAISGLDVHLPVVQHGPVEPVLGVLTGCWWLLREVELATIR
eukprot:2529718-Amphidinium_carterae.1